MPVVDNLSWRYLVESLRNETDYGGESPTKA